MAEYAPVDKPRFLETIGAFNAAVRLIRNATRNTGANVRATHSGANNGDGATTKRADASNAIRRRSTSTALLQVMPRRQSR